MTQRIITACLPNQRYASLKVGKAGTASPNQASHGDGLDFQMLTPGGFVWFAIRGDDLADFVKIINEAVAVEVKKVVSVR